jgi:hypothetical protein
VAIKRQLFLFNPALQNSLFTKGWGDRRGETMTPEAKVKARVRKVLDEHKVYHFMPATGGYGRAGVPDIIACFNGQFIAIETKAGKGKTTALQERELSRIAESGGVTFVINEDNLDDLGLYFMTFDDDGRC